MNADSARTYVEALVSGLSILTAETPADATYRLGLMALINGGDPTPEQSAELARRRTLLLVLEVAEMPVQVAGLRRNQRRDGLARAGAPMTPAGKRLLDAARSTDNPYIGLHLPEQFVVDAILAIEAEAAAAERARIYAAVEVLPGTPCYDVDCTHVDHYGYVSRAAVLAGTEGEHLAATCQRCGFSWVEEVTRG